MVGFRKFYILKKSWMKKNSSSNSRRRGKFFALCRWALSDKANILPLRTANSMKTRKYPFLLCFPFKWPTSYPPRSNSSFFARKRPFRNLLSFHPSSEKYFDLSEAFESAFAELLPFYVFPFLPTLCLLIQCVHEFDAFKMGESQNVATEIYKKLRWLLNFWDIIRVSHTILQEILIRTAFCRGF